MADDGSHREMGNVISTATGYLLECTSVPVVVLLMEAICTMIYHFRKPNRNDTLPSGLSADGTGGAFYWWKFFCIADRAWQMPLSIIMATSSRDPMYRTFLTEKNCRCIRALQALHSVYAAVAQLEDTVRENMSGELVSQFALIVFIFGLSRL